MLKRVVLTLGLLMSQFSVADLTVVVVDPSSLPYDLGPSNIDNQASSLRNNESGFGNGASSFGNQASSFDNRRSNYANGPEGSRRLLTEDDLYVGYYVTRSNGHINYFYASGTRFGFTPSGGHTDSIFSGGSWCGTIGQVDGLSVLGLTRPCYEKLTRRIQEEQEASRKFCLETHERYKKLVKTDPKGEDV